MKRKNYQRGTDSVNAKLTPREAVLNVNAAELLGRHNIAALNAHGNMLADHGVNLASLPSDPTPGPSTENMLGYAYGTDDVRRNMRTTDRYYRGINISRGASPNAITDTSAGQVITGSGGGGGYGIGRGQLPPDQNPAYQAAISRPRLQRGDLTTIRTPSGGYITVPSGSAGRAAQAVPGSQVTQIGNQFPIDRVAQVAKGFGEPNPTIQSSVSGPVQVQGGVSNPIENLTPQQRVAGGVGGTLDNIITNPSLNVASNFLTNAASRVASAVGNFFGGGNNNTVGPSFPPSTGASAPSPTPTPYQTPNPVAPSPTPTPTPPQQQPFNTPNDQNLIGYQYGTSNVMPRRYSDYY